jgi:cobalt-zinc-cadmium efflux system protein
LAGWLGWAAVRRLVHPAAVAGGPVLATALAGCAVNLVAGALVSRADRRSLNVEGAYQHILTDLFAFAATATAGLVVLTTGFTRADGIASLLVVGLMVRAGAGLVLESGRIFLEGAPAGVDPAVLGARLADQPAVTEVHDLHVWQITSGQPAASAHVLVVPGGDCHAVRRRLEEVLRSEYGIGHSTLQVDHAGPAVLAVCSSGDPGGGIGSGHGCGTAGPEANVPEANVQAHCPDPHGPVHRPAGSPAQPS